MSGNAFIGKTERPTEEELAAALGPALAAWDRLLTGLEQQQGVDVREWKSHSPKLGWALRLCRRKRTIVWLSPQSGCFEALFILGGKAMQAAGPSKWPARIADALKAAPKYPEGYGVRLRVKSPRDVGALIRLAAVKIGN